MLEGKTVVLAVSGSIAAYKSAGLARRFKKLGADVQVLMTKNATYFINPITFESLTGTKCLIDTFDRNFEFSVEHVALAKRADLVLLAPASANVIGKICAGIADDMLTTTIMACTCPKIIAPAMNHNMYHNPIVQDNLRRLAGYGYEIIAPGHGMLANGDEGDGRMPDEDLLLEASLRQLTVPRDLAGKKVLVTAGPTQEAIDPVRFITNHSTGRMGYAVAAAAMRRGAQVTLVSGPTALRPPYFVETVPVVSAEDMYQAVTERAPESDYIIMTAAVADYRPQEAAQEKIKKGEGPAVLPLVRTKDILAALGQNRRPGQVICGFSMETEELIAHSRDKLARKNVDMIAANSLREEGAGFGVETNRLTLITKEKTEELPLMTKEEAAGIILDRLIGLGEER